MTFNIDDIQAKDLSAEKFWLTDPLSLFKNIEIIPKKTMTQAQRLNALTRLLLLIVLYLYWTENDNYITVLILGLLLIIVLRNQDEQEHFAPHRGQFNPCRECGSCGYDSQRAYINQKYEVTPENQYTHLNDGLRSYTHAKYRVIPVDTPAPMRETWRNEQRWCNEFSAYPESYTISPDMYDNVPQPKCYFNDQMSVTVTGDTPCQIQRKPGLQSRQSNFTMRTNEFRNSILGDYVDQYMRQRNHICTNFKPGRKTS
jgi:hypothetical protein